MGIIFYHSYPNKATNSHDFLLLPQFCGMKSHQSHSHPKTHPVCSYSYTKHGAFGKRDPGFKGLMHSSTSLQDGYYKL